MARWIPGWLALALAATAVLTTSSLTSTPPACAAPPAGNPPPEVITYFTRQDIARGQAYTHGRYWLFAAGTLLRLSVLAILVLTPASAALRNLAVRVTPAHPAVAVATYIAWLVLVYELLTIPLGFYAGFVREHAFGLSTQTAGGWLLVYTIFELKFAKIPGRGERKCRVV